MQRLIYDPDSKKVISIIDPCEGTITGTPHQILEGTAEEIAAAISRLGLTQEDDQ